MSMFSEAVKRNQGGGWKGGVTGGSTRNAVHNTAGKANNIVSPGGGGGTGPGSAVDNLWKDRPNRKGLTNKYGDLSSRYKLNTPGSRLHELDDRLGGISDVQTGANFNLAEGDVANIRNFASSTGDSPWAAAQRNQLGIQQAIGRDQLSNQYGAQIAGGLSQLGATGGYDGGSRERLIASAGKDKMMGLQGLHRTGQMGGTQIGIADAANKQNMMQNLPGMAMGLEQHQAGLDQYNNQLGMDKVNMWKGQANLQDQQKLATDQWNKSNLINDRYQGNDWNMNQWMQKGNLSGATATSNAMMNSANQDRGLFGSGGFLGTGIG